MARVKRRKFKEGAKWGRPVNAELTRLARNTILDYSAKIAISVGLTERQQTNLENRLLYKYLPDARPIIKNGKQVGWYRPKPVASKRTAINRFKEGGVYDKLANKKNVSPHQMIERVFGKEEAHNLNARFLQYNTPGINARGLQASLKAFLTDNSEWYEAATEEEKDEFRKFNSNRDDARQEQRLQETIERIEARKDAWLAEYNLDRYGAK